MKRILHISKLYAPNEGGIEKISKLVVESLPDYEHQVVCFSSTTKGYSDTINGITIHRVGTAFNLFSQQVSFRFFFKLKQLIKTFKPDLIHFHAPNPLVMLYVNLLIPASCKLVIHWHSDIIEQTLLYQFVKPIERKALKRADAIIATSSNYVLHSYPLEQFKNKVTVVPCAIDPTEYAKENIDQQRKQALGKQYEGKKIVFFVGRHVTYKGLTYLIKAEKYLQQDCVILIGGTGPLTNKLKQENNSSRIVFLGRLSDKDLLAYHYMADIFVLPSITKNEAFGLVLAEAMYCERPVVTFTIPGSGVNWVNLNQETGLEVENSNPHQYAKAIDRLLADASLRTSLGKKGRERVELYFTRDRVIEPLTELYGKLLG